ncbi:MAG: acyl-CoA carboxylase subunit epsilon [Acidimicrobiales bacterium]|jgi:hypothetical protein
MATSRSDGAPAEGEVEGEISVRGMPNEAETAALIAVLSGLRSPAGAPANGEESTSAWRGRTLLSNRVHGPIGPGRWRSGGRA